MACIVHGMRCMQVLDLGLTQLSPHADQRPQRLCRPPPEAQGRSKGGDHSQGISMLWLPAAGSL